MEKNPPAVQETQGRYLGGEDPLEKETATHSSILAWEIPDREAWQATVNGLTKSWTQLCNWACKHTSHSYQHDFQNYFSPSVITPPYPDISTLIPHIITGSSKTQGKITRCSLFLAQWAHSGCSAALGLSFLINNEETFIIFRVILGSKENTLCDLLPSIVHSWCSSNVRTIIRNLFLKIFSFQF